MPVDDFPAGAALVNRFFHPRQLRVADLIGIERKKLYGARRVCVIGRGHRPCRTRIENFSGRAWQNVDLTLLSGNPVTFRQALYESYYVPRANVPVESGGRVLPPPDYNRMMQSIRNDIRNDKSGMRRGMENQKGGSR